jgi:tRNA pseudouridine32 synthase/23S rRNA pseudouridine746 synthase
LKHLHNFKTDISEVQLPEKFTFPFYYEPHQLAKIASKEIQEYLELQTDFNHNFGLKKSNSSIAIGKMFGVLVVQNKKKELGYLAAFSGKLDDNSLPEKFVPPVFNMRTDGSFYIEGEAEIDTINDKLKILENDKNYLQLKEKLQKTTKEIDADLALQRKKIKIAKADRKARKKIALSTLPDIDFKKVTEKLKQESYNQQFFYKELQEYHQTKIDKIQKHLVVYQHKINALKQQRKEKSNYLQQTLFENYAFLNQQKEIKSLLSIFNDPKIKPPAGSGECAAPKLLQ